jgi:NAD-dependent deacetylase
MTRTILPRDHLPQDLIDALSRTRRLAVLTGAGVSAESGVPTFRDARTGLWAHHDPMALASPEGFDADPRLVWNWYQWRRELIARAEPNAGHRSLAELARHVDLDLITQNVDGLHQRGGSASVLELHGNIQRTICSKTRRIIDSDWLERHADRQPPPSPHAPDGRARPDVVWFGEALDPGTLEQAFTAARRCDLMIVAGTAGAVHPAASLPVLAVEHGARVIDINPATSELTRLADWHLKGGSAHWLPILTAVGRKD